MSSQLQTSRLRAFERQGGKCFYCGVSMLLRAPQCLARLLCTAEHVVPKSQGGSDGQANIVAACALQSHTPQAQEATSSGGLSRTGAAPCSVETLAPSVRGRGRIPLGCQVACRTGQRNWYRSMNRGHTSDTQLSSTSSSRSGSASGPVSAAHSAGVRLESNASATSSANGSGGAA
jgi:hypothetical protein